jgi:hypothetical protein
MLHDPGSEGDPALCNRTGQESFNRMKVDDLQRAAAVCDASSTRRREHILSCRTDDGKVGEIDCLVAEAWPPPILYGVLRISNGTPNTGHWSEDCLDHQGMLVRICIK